MKMKLKNLLLTLLVFVMLLPGTVNGEKQELQKDQTIQRLVKLCDTWGKVKFFHPYLAYKDIDWDAALIDTLPLVYKAKSHEEFTAAVDKMLQILGDPITTTAPVEKDTAKSQLPHLKDSISSKEIDGFLVLTFSDHAPVNGYGDILQAIDKIKTFFKKITAAKGLLFDFRKEKGNAGSSGYSFMFGRSGLNRYLFNGAVFSPSSRSRFHQGFAPERGMTSGAYYSGFQVSNPKRWDGGSKVEEKPIVFLFNRGSEVPEVALGLQAAGKAVVIAEGTVYDHGIAEYLPVELDENTEVRIRTSQLVNSDGSPGIRANIVFPVQETFKRESKAFQAALDLLKDFKVPPLEKGQYIAARTPVADYYSDMEYPNREYRILALFKAWNVFRYFFPYNDLIQEDWEEVLEEYIPKMEKAGDALQYGLTLLEFLTHAHDSHVTLGSKAVREYLGRTYPPFMLQMIENRPVVVRVLDVPEAKESGIAVGDVIVNVDGVAAQKRLKELVKYIPASTPQAMWRNAVQYLVRGPDKSTLSLTVERAGGKRFEIKIPRKSGYVRQLRSKRDGEIFKLLSSDIGYADLDRLKTTEVDKMFDLFKDTRAIIFDGRGYPWSTAWSIAPRLTEKKDVKAAKFKGVIARPSEYYKTNYFMEQPVPKSEKWKYKGKTVMLIDERTQSQAEHTGLFFEAANGTEFIGSHTAGANGDITYLVLPGGVTVTFTGQAVSHADGRQLQRIGLVPHLEVKPTIDGIRQGKDEVLDAAIDYVKKKI